MQRQGVSDLGRSITNVLSLRSKFNSAFGNATKYWATFRWVAVDLFAFASCLLGWSIGLVSLVGRSVGRSVSWLVD